MCILHVQVNLINTHICEGSCVCDIRISKTQYLTSWWRAERLLWIVISCVRVPYYWSMCLHCTYENCRFLSVMAFFSAAASVKIFFLIWNTYHEKKNRKILDEIPVFMLVWSYLKLLMIIAADPTFPYHNVSSMLFHLHTAIPAWPTWFFNFCSENEHYLNFV